MTLYQPAKKICINSLILLQLGYLITINYFRLLLNLEVLKEGREEKFTEAIDLLTLKPLKQII